MKTASPPPASPAPPPGPARTGMALGLAGLGLAVIAGLVWLVLRTPAPVPPPVDPVQAIAADLVRQHNAGLPRDLGDGLVLERMTVEGRTVLMILRSKGMTLAEAARNPARFQRVREEEQARLLAYCSQRDFRLVLDEGVVLTRRFIDREGQRFFDVSLAAADCRPKT